MKTKLTVSASIFEDAVNLRFGNECYIGENIFGPRLDLTSVVDYYFRRYNDTLETCNTDKCKADLDECKIALASTKENLVNLNDEILNVVIEHYESRIENLELMIKLANNCVSSAKSDYEIYKSRLEKATELLEHITIVK